ncbi:LemA family protein [Candidatus Gottesmanbacteria bacterium]|nr:LemA family protein [Candidatus Gottesmanbacteria bacterium]
MTTPLWILVGAIVLIVGYLWSLYNGLVSLKTQIEEAWSEIDVQLKRRADLIPNLVETVKGYAKHEKSIFTAVTNAHKAMLGATSLAKKAQASDVLSSALGKLIALAENYPDLKANENFVQLQKELSDTEDKVAYSRQFYNTTVLDYNTRLRTFPNSLIAKQLGFAEKEFFGATDTERQPVKVTFS